MGYYLRAHDRHGLEQSFRPWKSLEELRGIGYIADSVATQQFTLLLLERPASSGKPQLRNALADAGDTAAERAAML